MDGISACSSDLVTAAMAATSSMGTAVAVSMLDKTMDNQTIALTQLLQQAGVGNNIDALA